jgi:hypothetical protein
MSEEHTITGYKLAKLVNVQRRELGLESIPPQMIYNYLRNGYITGVKGSGQTPRLEDAERWMDKYVTKLRERVLES